MTGDWHPSDIKARIEKKRSTLAALGRAYGLGRRLISLALCTPHRAAEQAIADFLDIPPYRIWPSRYHVGGTRKRPQPTENYRRRPRFERAEAAAC